MEGTGSSLLSPRPPAPYVPHPRYIEKPETAFERPGLVRPHFLLSLEQRCPQRTCPTPAPAADMLGPLLDVGAGGQEQAVRVSGSGKGGVSALFSGFGFKEGGAWRRGGE